MRTGYLRWNVRELAEALHIAAEDVTEYFRDGRRVSFLVERRIACEVLQGSLARSEGAGWDVIDQGAGKWEVRSISRRGVYFCPSYMVGSGRHFDEEGFLSKMGELEGYILADIEGFPEIRYWVVPVSTVQRWWHSDELGTASKVPRAKALRLLEEAEDDA